jgi:hypothetical protein
LIISSSVTKFVSLIKIDMFNGFDFKNRIYFELIFICALKVTVKWFQWFSNSLEEWKQSLFYLLFKW